jgi:hypothetical protein
MYLWGFIAANNPIFVLGLFTAFFVLNLGLIIYLGNRTELFAKIFAVGCFFVVLWTLGTMLYQCSTAELVSNDVTRLFFKYIQPFLYYTGFLIVSTFFYFCYRYPTGEDPNWAVAKLLVLSAILVWPLFFMTDLVVGAHLGYTGTVVFGVPAGYWYVGPLIHWYSVFFAGLPAYGVWLVYGKMKNATDEIVKKNLLIMISSLLIGFVFTFICSTFLPAFQNTDYCIIGMIVSNFWTITVGYSIIKYRQMNVNFVYAEGIVLIMIFILFINIFLP